MHFVNRHIMQGAFMFPIQFPASYFSVFTQLNISVHHHSNKRCALNKGLLCIGCFRLLRFLSVVLCPIMSVSM